MRLRLVAAWCYFVREASEISSGAGGGCAVSPRVVRL